MAYQTAQHTPSGAPVAGFLGAVAGFFSRAGTHLIENSAGARRIQRVEALRAKTDAELEAMGLQRDQIVRHVFKDIMYI